MFLKLKASQPIHSYPKPAKSEEIQWNRIREQY